MQCHKNTTGPLYALYCLSNNTEACAYFNANNATSFPAIPGLASGVFYSTLFACLVGLYIEAPSFQLDRAVHLNTSIGTVKCIPKYHY